MEPTERRRFYDPAEFAGLSTLVDCWTEIRDELGHFQFGSMPIHRVAKTHDQVYSEIRDHVGAGGGYGWLLGWGPRGANENWTQLGLVAHDQPIPFLDGAFPRTLGMLGQVPDIKVAAFVKLDAGHLLGTHRHPELLRDDLLQFHLTLEAASERNDAYLGVAGEFRRHVPGVGFVFDGSLDHFAFNASTEDRTILYIEFGSQGVSRCPKRPVQSLS